MAHVGNRRRGPSRGLTFGLADLRDSLAGITSFPVSWPVVFLLIVAEEREEISRGIAAGLSARTIAGRISRPSSTVSTCPGHKNSNESGYHVDGLVTSVGGLA